MPDFFSPDAIQAFLTVVFADLIMAGDNAVVIGLAAAGLPKEQRNKAVLIGILAATVLRIGFALIASQLLAIVGLLLAGGVLLLWVCWKMWRELRAGGHDDAGEALDNVDHNADGQVTTKGARKTLLQAVTQIVVADVSMSLDNVLVVAGAAHDHPWIMVFGLALSVILMGVAATLIARLLHKYRWIGFVGLLIILYVAGHMIWDGAWQVYHCNPSWYGETEFGPHCPIAKAAGAGH